MVSTIAHTETDKNQKPSVCGYDENKAWALYSSVDIHNCHPDYIRDEDIIRSYVSRLSELLNMKCMGDTRIIKIGSDVKCEGFSMVQFIESSMISGHFAHKNNNAYIDIFSCKYYDPEIVSHFSLSFFKGRDYTLNVTVRK
ncbi:MAG: S-adenosylmethionine decarboxylase [Spirochaetes bacterium]|nr:S-adenosylmethionine decarboxylase [Spirochaetota bacterium]